MTTDNEDYSGRSPDSLLNTFSKSRILFFVLVAVGIHVVLLLLTSTGYIRDRWIDPEGAKERAEAAVEAKKNEALGGEANANTNVVAESEGGAAVAESGGGDAVATSTNASLVLDGVDVPDSATNSAIIRAITEEVKPEDIPKDSELGISLEDTRTR